jgi:hypothetical protein
MSEFKPSYRGIGELLTAEFMQVEMRRRAEKGKAYAEAIAPDAPPYGVGYKYEFEVTSGVKESKKGTKRAFGRVTNNSDHAMWVEFGGQNTPAHRTLGKSLTAMGD